MTARRYAGIFRALGYRVEIADADARDLDADVVVALHAKRSARAALAYRSVHPEGRLIVVLTGTDIYRDLPRSRLALRALEAADAIVALQPLALRRLAPPLRAKARTIFQSVTLPTGIRKRTSSGDALALCVLGHLRKEKDSLRAAYAVRSLPANHSLRITIAGGILDPRYAKRIADELAQNPHLRYLGERSQRAALALLARSDALVIPSRMEGGANVVGEAIALGVPVIASRIDGNIGMLGEMYEGYFEVGSTTSLRRLLLHFSSDPQLRRRLTQSVARLASNVLPKKERAAWKALLTERLAPR